MEERLSGEKFSKSDKYGKKWLESLEEVRYQ